MELIDITDTLVFDDEPSIFDEETALDLIESALHLMEDYLNENPTAVSEPDFHETMLEEIQDIFALQFEDHTNNDFSDYMEDDLNELLEEAFDIFINTYNIERTPESASITDDDEIVERIDYLRSKPQPDQRTKEWYEFRHNLITASNAYKAFESQAMVNQLIYEKCQPIKSGNDDKLSMVNVNTTFHWGQKYEPLSVMIYEDMYNTKVEDFGCIQHDTHNFLGASPDGINVDKTSDRYGRMLEIKNIVNREITGIPKKEYWIQTQLQMEVCDLNECDFLETKFTEYETANDFFNDETDKKKGIILYFNTKEGKPFYIYKPLDILTVDEITEWEQETIDKHQANNMMWIKNLYWKLEIMSCVLILRNRKWFEDNIEQLGKVWKIIEEERITGYQHRAPNKRIKKEIQPQVTEGCLLDLTKFTPLKNLDH
jgi:putative phage-type endonuclease